MLKASSSIFCKKRTTGASSTSAVACWVCGGNHFVEVSPTEVVLWLGRQSKEVPRGPK